MDEIMDQQLNIEIQIEKINDNSGMMSPTKEELENARDNLKKIYSECQDKIKFIEAKKVII
jgi:hypothetical protein